MRTNFSWTGLTPPMTYFDKQPSLSKKDIELSAAIKELTIGSVDSVKIAKSILEKWQLVPGELESLIDLKTRVAEAASDEERYEKIQALTDTIVTWIRSHIQSH